MRPSKIDKGISTNSANNGGSTASRAPGPQTTAGPVGEVTPRQRDTLDFIRTFVAENGYPPAVRDICAGLGLSSTQTVHAHLHKLKDKGFIRLGKTHRSLQLVNTPPKLIPLIGRVAAGAPVLATENVEGYLDLGGALAGDMGNRFALRVKGLSMIGAGIMDGDYIVVRLQQTAENGDIVVALISDEATVKLFYREEDRIRLQPANPSMEPIYPKDVTIVGKVLASFRAYEAGTCFQSADA